MNVASRVQIVAVAVILLGTLASGPLDLTDPRREETDLGEGSVDVTSVTLPETVTLQRGRYGADGYYLQVPEATVEFERVTGGPVVGYTLEIPELSYTRQTAYFLNDGTTGSVSYGIEKDTFAPREIQKPAYRGELRLVVRSNGTERVLKQRNVTVRVRE